MDDTPLALTVLRGPTATPTAGLDQSSLQTRREGSLIGKIAKAEVLDEEPDDIGDMDEVPGSFGEVPTYEAEGSERQDLLSLIVISDTPEEQSVLRTLISRYADIFNTEVHRFLPTCNR